MSSCLQAMKKNAVTVKRRDYAKLSSFSIAKANESRYIALFVVSESMKNLFSNDCVNIYFSQSIALPIFIFFQCFFQ